MPNSMHHPNIALVTEVILKTINVGKLDTNEVLAEAIALNLYHSGFIHEGPVNRQIHLDAEQKATSITKEPYYGLPHRTLKLTLNDENGRALHMHSETTIDKKLLVNYRYPSHVFAEYVEKQARKMSLLLGDVLHQRAGAERGGYPTSDDEEKN
jgi:hypothetical protein